MTQGVVVDFSAQIARFTSGIDKMTNDLNKFQSHSSRVSANIGKTFAMLGVGLSAAGMTSFIKSNIDAADALNDMSIRLGVTVKDLASFKLAAEQSGTSLEGVGVGMARLTRSIGEAEGGNKQLAESLKTLGITARDPKEAFFQLADAVKRIQDPAMRAALLSDVLGKSYQDLVPMLNEGGEALRKTALETEGFADTMARMAPEADKFNDQLAAMKLNSAGVASSFVSDLLPGLNQIMEAMRIAAKEGGILNATLVGIGGVMTGIFTDDLMDRQSKILKDMVGLKRMVDSSLPEYAKEKSREKLAALQQELDGLNKINEAEKIKSQNAKKFKDDLSKFIGAESGIKPSKTGKTEKPGKPQEMLDYDAHFKDFLKKIQHDQDEANSAMEQNALKAQSILFDVDPVARAGHEWEKLTELVEMGLLSQENAVKKYEQMFGDSTKKMDDSAKRLSENIQRNLGDVLYDGLNGKFEDIGDTFKQMLLRMSADAAAAQLTQKMFGKAASGGNDGGWLGSLVSIGASIFGGGGGGTDMASSLGGNNMDGSFYSSPSGYSFEGGGFTGDGSRSGGVDGKGGFRAILHPNETVIDHAKGGRSGSSITYAPVINIDSRTDRAEVQRLVSGAVRQGNAELVDRLQRAGALA